MESHHRDALVTGMVGILCGAVIGSGYMGFVFPFIHSENAADWFSGFGTWVVGIAAAALTVQQHNAKKKADELEQERLLLEQRTSAARLAAEAEERKRQESQQQLADIAKFKTAVTRLQLPHMYFQTTAKDLSILSLDNLHALARAVKASIPALPLSSGNFVLTVDLIKRVASLEVAGNLCSSLCDGLLSSGDPHALSADNAAFVLAGRRRMSDIAGAAAKLNDQASELALIIDNLIEQKAVLIS